MTEISKNLEGNFYIQYLLDCPFFQNTKKALQKFQIKNLTVKIFFLKFLFANINFWQMTNEMASDKKKHASRTNTKEHRQSP